MNSKNWKIGDALYWNDDLLYWKKRYERRINEKLISETPENMLKKALDLKAVYPEPLIIIENNNRIGWITFKSNDGGYDKLPYFWFRTEKQQYRVTEEGFLTCDENWELGKLFF